MRGAVLYAPRDMRLEERDDPEITEPGDAIIRISATCVRLGSPAIGKSGKVIGRSPWPASAWASASAWLRPGPRRRPGFGLGLGFGLAWASACRTCVRSAGE